MANIQVQIVGLDRLLRKVSPELLAVPMKNFFYRAVITMQGRARNNAPVDTGRLRSSIAYEIDSAAVPHWGSVGTNVQYARPMEFGTGLLSEDPQSSHTRHFPPGDALDTWAARHGMSSGWAVAKAIGRRGGLRPRRFLRKAFEDSLGDLRGLVQRLGDEIRAAWERK